MLKTNPNPKFTEPAAIPVCGGETFDLPITFRYMRQSAAKKHWEDVRTKPEAEQLLPLIDGWDAKVAGEAIGKDEAPLNVDNLTELLDIHAGAGLAIATAFNVGLRGGRAKN
jgi:hypothetical protein